MICLDEFKLFEKKSFIFIPSIFENIFNMKNLQFINIIRNLYHEFSSDITLNQFDSYFSQLPCLQKYFYLHYQKI